MIKMTIIIIYYYSIAFFYTITINVYIYMCIIVYIYISPQGLWTELAQSCFRTSGIIPAKLVGGFNQPLLKILVSWDYYSQLNGKIKNVPNHQREKISTIGPSSSGMQVLWSSALPNWNPWDLQVLFCRNWKVKQLRGLHKETHEGCINHATTWWIRRSWLVGGIPTPLKNMSSSVGMMKFPTKWKNKSCSKPHIWKNPDNFRCKLDSVHLVEPRTVSLPTPKGLVFVVPDFVVGKHQLVDVLQLLLFYIYIYYVDMYIYYILYIYNYTYVFHESSTDFNGISWDSVRWVGKPWPPPSSRNGTGVTWGPGPNAQRPVSRLHSAVLAGNGENRGGLLWGE